MSADPDSSVNTYLAELEKILSVYRDWRDVPPDDLRKADDISQSAAGVRDAEQRLHERAEAKRIEVLRELLRRETDSAKTIELGNELEGLQNRLHGD